MKSKSFRLLWIGQAVANFGDVLYIVGLISILYSITGSAFYLALLPFFNTIGRFFGGIVSPILLNLYRLKTLLIVSQICKTVVLFGLCFWISFQSVPSIWLILLFILIVAFLDGWAMPATMAMLPRLVGKSEIMKANSFVSVIDETVQLGGWAVGGMMVAILSGQNVIWVTFGLFLISTIILLGIVDDTPFQVKKVKGKTGLVLKDGWILIWENPLFRSIHGMIIFEAIANVVWIAAILYVFVAEVLHTTEAWWGYLNTSFFIGLILGGLVCSRFAVLIEGHIRKIMIISSFSVSIVTFLFGFNSVAWIALILAAIHGIVDQIKGITINTFLQKEATSDELPKLYAAQGAVISLLFGLSSLAFGAITDLFNVQFSFTLAGILLLGSTVFVYVFRSQFPERYIQDE